MSTTTNPDKNTVIIFLHLPKTGGTTLRWIINRQYPSNAVVKYNWSFHYMKVPLDEFRQLPFNPKLRLITGHMAFGLHDAVQSQCTYVAMMRNPVDRVLSHYYHVRRNPGHPLHSAALSMDIAEFMQSGIAPDVDNGQTRRLSGVGADVPYSQCGEQELQQAQRNIQNHFAVVGLTEMFDESMLLFAKILGWSPYYISQNRGSNKQAAKEIPAKTLDLIRAHNQLDIRLYEFVKERFQRRLSAVVSNTDQKVQRFRRVNSTLFRIYIFPHLVASKIQWMYKQSRKESITH